MNEAAATVATQRGRARDPAIDDRVLTAAAEQLARRGFGAMSVAAIAEEAGTTRQAIYRRWSTKSELAAAAMAATEPDQITSASSAGPFADLVAELASFQRGINKPGRLSLVGTMLQASTDRDAAATYRQRVVAPRRRRLRTIFDRAHELGQIDPDADLDLLVTMCTGSWYARALAGGRPPTNWALRTAQLAWRAAGGTPPSLDRGAQAGLPSRPPFS